MKKSPLKAADATLVSAAFRHGQAQVPQYDPEAIKTEAGLAGTVLKGVKKGIKSIQDAKKEEELKRKVISLIMFTMYLLENLVLN